MFVRAVSLIVVAAAVGLSISNTALAVPAGQGIGGRTWTEDFNGTQLNPAVWLQRGVQENDGAYLPTAVSVGGGNMKITTYSHSFLPGLIPPSHYTGQVSTEGLLSLGVLGFQQKYGYFETRANFSTQSGMFSAFWLQSSTNGINPNGSPAGPYGAEIDIVEHRRFNNFNPGQFGITPTTDITNRVHSAVIWNGYGAGQQLVTNLSGPRPGLSNNTWHTYGLRWSPSEYIFFVDDQEIWRTSTGISNVKEFIVLGTNIWGAFAGPLPTGPAGYGTLQTSNAWAQFDYVHVYGLNGISSVPEPAGLSLLATGTVALAMIRRRGLGQSAKCILNRFA